MILNNTVPVLVLTSSQHGGVGVIRSLGREGIPVYGVHQNLWEPSARSHYLRGIFKWDFSSSSSDESVSFLLDIGRKIRPRPILVVTSDENALLVAENADTLASEYTLTTPSADVVRTFFNKKMMHNLCRKHGIPTPQTALPGSRAEALQFAQKVKFPIIIKGEYDKFLFKKDREARVAIVSSERELMEIFELNAAKAPPGIILQEYIPGSDDTIWMFNGYFNEQSQCLFQATGRKLRQYPVHRGSTCLGICLENETVKVQSLRLMQAVGYRGPLDLGFRFDARDGLYKLLDVNPRMGATSRLFVADNGLDTVRTLYLDLTGQTVPAAQMVEGRKWLVESNDLVSSCRYFLERELCIWDWLVSLRGIEEGVWLMKDDPLPMFMLPLLLWRKLFQKPAPQKTPR
jgi:predicted ATP-grasp superfamily ATP-dependent carboligase